MILAAAVLASAPVRGDDAMLFWFVDDPVIGGTSGGIGDLPGVAEATYAAARVVAVSGDTRTYVPIIDTGDAEFDAFGAFMPDEDGAWRTANPLYANLGAYTSDPATLFAIEIGIYTDDDWTDWKILATSGSLTYQQLNEMGHISPSEMVAPEHGPWSGGTTYTIPEPSGGLLFLIGGGLLALRRRGRKA